jgi:alanine-synthesizing transaminase
MFSHRTSWHRHSNKLNEMLEQRMKNALPVYDLTVSNPTVLGFPYPDEDILAALKNPRVLHYQPDPRGILSARQTVCDYYAKKNISVDPSSIFLTASTSESYSLLLKLLCNANETILVPSPSYPLFEYLAQINDVGLQNYFLRYDGRWHIDIDSLRASLRPSTRAIILINPHNPTGAFLQTTEYAQILQIAAEHDCSLIVDEVFIDYKFDSNTFSQTTATTPDVLTFTLNGISKYAGLPQMKLGWIVISGPANMTREAISRLEILNDTFLSVNTPVQVALPEILDAGKDVSLSILNRVRGNYTILKNLFQEGSPCSLLHCDGGWSAILQLPRTKSDEVWALELLDIKGVYVYPGYFFDMTGEAMIVVSLLQREEVFQHAVRDILAHVDVSIRGL